MWHSQDLPQTEKCKLCNIHQVIISIAITSIKEFGIQIHQLANFLINKLIFNAKAPAITIILNTIWKYAVSYLLSEPWRERFVLMEFLKDWWPQCLQKSKRWQVQNQTHNSSINLKLPFKFISDPSIFYTNNFLNRLYDTFFIHNICAIEIVIETVIFL